jgi:hypothetical protein
VGLGSWVCSRKGTSPCEVEGVADEEADPLVLCDDGQQNQLCEIEGEIQRKEGIRVDVKGIRPFDGRIGGRCMGGRGEEHPVGKEAGRGQSQSKCAKAPYRSRVAVTTPTRRKSRRIMTNASLSASSTVYEYTTDQPIAATATGQDLRPRARGPYHTGSHRAGRVWPGRLLPRCSLSLQRGRSGHPRRRTCSRLW